MTDQEIFEKWETFKQILLGTGRENINNVVEWLDKSDFKFAPASICYHNSFRGGLLKHSLDVYYQMYDFTSHIKFFDLSDETIAITSLLHDICKVNCYETYLKNVKTEDGQWIKEEAYKWNELEPLGHGDKSVMLIQYLGVKLSKVEIAMIRNHMGFSNGEDPKRVSALFSNCPQSLLLHWADEACTFINESKDLQQRYKQKLLGRNITESLQINKDKTEYVVIDGTKYKLAKENETVDDKNIIKIVDNKTGNIYNVYAPYRDGLPF